MTTITDVAKRAGVAPVTVSRVMNGASNVNPATRARVEQAIAELGYVPNVAARSLRSKRTRSLAFVVPDINNAFWTTVARGVEDAAQSHGYSVLLCNTDEDLAKQQRYLDIMISQRVDGIIIAPCDQDASKLSALRDHDIATVVIDRRINGWDVDTVYCDSLSGAYALTKHLIDLGHTRIAVLSGPEGAPTAEDRIAGYRLAMDDSGIELDPRLIRRGRFSLAAGLDLAGQVLDEGLAPTAIFAANNAIALGVVDAVGARGLRIPGDVALVCFDDYPYISSFFPFLTIVAQPAYDMGANAAQLLLSRLESPVPLQPRRVVLPVRLIIRHSCGRAAASAESCPLNLPLQGLTEPKVMLVKSIVAGAADAKTATAAFRAGASSYGGRRNVVEQVGKPDISRLLRALRWQPVDRIPHLELRVTGRAVYEYVLERELKFEPHDPRLSGVRLAPEEQVEFAQRLGIDAVACECSWQGDAVARRGRSEPPAPLAAQLNYLERHLRAAQGSGVGVFASFNSFYASALQATGYVPGTPLTHGAQMQLESVMDALLAQGEQMIGAVCDRFATDLAFVLVSDDVVGQQGLALPPGLFGQLFRARMRRLITPALEHGVVTVLHSGGRLEAVLPLLHEIGFSVVHGLDPDVNDLSALRHAWAGRLALMGGISNNVLSQGDRDSVTEAVRRVCTGAGASSHQTGFVLGSVNGISEAIPPHNFGALVEAVRKYSRQGVSNLAIRAGEGDGEWAKSLS